MTMNLLLGCNSVDETKAFYAEVLDFEVFDSAEGSCTVRKEGGTIIFSGVDLWGGPPHCTGTIYIFLAVRWPLQDMSYGTREFAIKDCNGYTLAFAQNREQPAQGAALGFSFD